MKRKLVSIFLSIIYIISLAQSIIATEESNNVYRLNNEIIVKYKKNVNPELVKNRLNTRKTSKELIIKDRINIKECEVECLEINDEDNLDDIIETLKADPNVEYAEPNYKVHMLNDPSYPLQWGLKNVEQIVDGQRGNYGYDVNIEQARDLTQGNPSVTVAVIDTGIDINHEDLYENIFKNVQEIEDGIDNDGNGYIDDMNGWNFTTYVNVVNNGNNQVFGGYEDEHGTHISGIIGAEINGKGIEGIAPKIKILPVKFIDSSGYGNVFNAVLSIQYAEQMGAIIANCSWGSYNESQFLKDTINSSNMLFICAAGNDGDNIDNYPAAYALDNIISVAAMDNRGDLAGTSNYGNNTTIAAPGIGIYSTLPYNNYGYLSGTSMAAPFVTGVAALVSSYRPILSSKQIAQIINTSSTLNTNLIGKVKTQGFVNAFSAVQSSVGNTICGHSIYASGMVNVNNSIYSVGGYNKVFLNALEVFNPVNNSWQERTPMNIARSHIGVASIGNSIYVIGGYDGSPKNAVERYDIDNDTWSTMKPLPVPLYAFGVCSFENEIYVFGGLNDQGYSDKVYVYDTAEGEWSLKTQLPYQVAYLNATKLNDGIYINGGVSETGALNKFYRYSPDSNTWKQCASMGDFRQNSRAVEYEGKIYVFGGSGQDIPDTKSYMFIPNNTETIGLDACYKTVEVYDPYTNTWGDAADMSSLKLGFNCVVIGNDILIVGGWLGDYSSETENYFGVRYPRDFNANITRNNLLIKWDRVAEATGYEIEINDEVTNVGGNTTFSLSAEYDQNYAIRVRAYNIDQTTIWSDYINKFVHDRRVTAQLINSNSINYGTLISNLDEHWYMVDELQAGAIHINLSDIPSGCSYEVDLCDSNGSAIVSGTDIDGDKIIDNFSLVSYPYYIRVYSLGGVSSEPYTLTAQFSEGEEIPELVKASFLTPQDDGSNALTASYDPNEFEELPEDYILTPSPLNNIPEIINNGFTTLSTINLNNVTVVDDLTNKVIKDSNSPYTVTGTITQAYAEGFQYYKIYLNAGDKLTLLYDETADTLPQIREAPWEFLCFNAYKATVAKYYYIVVQTRYGDNVPADYNFDIYCSTDSDEYEANDSYYRYRDWVPDDPLALTIKNRIGSNTKYIQPITAYFDNPADMDYYFVDLDAGDKLSIKIKMTDAGYDDVNNTFRISIFKLFGEVSGIYKYNNSNSYKVKFVTFIAPESGRYYILIERTKGNSDIIKNYKLTMTKVPAASLNTGYDQENYGSACLSNDFAKVKVYKDWRYVNYTPNKNISNLAEVTGLKLDNQLDVDWYRIKYDEDVTKKITLQSNNSGFKQYFNLKVFDKNLNLQPGNELVCKGDETYFIAVTSEQWNSIMSNPNYSLIIENSTHNENEVDLPLDSDLSACKEIWFNASETFVRLSEHIPAKKIVSVSFIPSYLQPDGTFPVPVPDAQDYIENIALLDQNGNELNLYGGWYGGAKTSYFKIENAGYYKIKIKFKSGVQPQQAYISVYTTDYIMGSKTFTKYDSSGQNPGSENNYLIFNAPERLLTQNQLGNNYRYISRMPVNGNANIYWEHLNEYGGAMTYGILLHNPSKTENAVVTINRKSAHFTDVKGLGRFRAPLQIWDDYFNNIITSDLTGINSSNNILTIGPNSSEWIYLADVPYISSNSDGLFNGVINLTVQENKTLDCYAFMMYTDVIDRTRIQNDFNVYGGISNNYLSYIRADGGYGYLSGTTNGPVLASNLNLETVKFTEGEKYKLLLTGYDAPKMNSGEHMPLYYDGVPVMNDDEGTSSNAQNFSVVYRFNISEFSGTRVVFQHNKYTNPNYLADPDSGIYVAYRIDDGINPPRYESQVLLPPKYSGYSTEFPVYNLPAGSFSLEIVVSGMSSMPLTVRFE